MGIGAFDDILGPDDIDGFEELEDEELEELDLDDLEKLFEETLADNLKKIQKKNIKVWKPKRIMNG